MERNKVQNHIYIAKEKKRGREYECALRKGKRDGKVIQKLMTPITWKKWMDLGGREGVKGQGDNGISCFVF